MSHPPRASNPDVIRNRVPYLPINDRPKLRLPGGARIAVWTIVNVEVWDSADPMPRTVVPPPMGQPLLPDVPNWAWHEYGMRAGFWRFLEVLGARGLRASFAVNGAACEIYPQACRAAHEAEWDFVGHGFMQRPMHRVDDQPGAIRKTIEAITALTGKPPRGWESPGLTETKETLDHLAAAGIEYVCDWCLDDQPVLLRSAPKPIVAMPYTLEINDVMISAVQGHRSDEIYLRGIDQFDRLYQEGAVHPRVMAISIHPYLTGVPHRIKYLEALYDHILGHEGVVMWTGSQILDWYLAETGGGSTR
jgi:allantoinase